MPSDKYAVRLLRAAEEDLGEIIRYISSDNLPAGEKMLERFENKFAALEEHPHRGSVPDDPNLIKAGYRYVVLSNYLVFYTVEGPTVLIHRIIHGARDLTNIL